MDDTPQTDQKVELRQVACPSCGDLNRTARRACKNPECKKTGKVWKNVPVESPYFKVEGTATADG